MGAACRYILHRLSRSLDNTHLICSVYDILSRGVMLKEVGGRICLGRLGEPADFSTLRAALASLRTP